jgi:hypothetical protein
MARALEQNPKTLPPKALRQWEHVYESAQARGLSKQGAAAQAWCAVKRKYKKSGSRWVLRKKPIPPSKQPPGCVKSRRANPQRGTEISIQEAELLPIGSLVALPSAEGGTRGAFVITKPGLFMRFGDYESFGPDPDGMLSIDEWMQSERAVAVHLVYKGKGKIPSESTMFRHWDAWWRVYKASRSANPPKINYAIIADERPVGWWSRPVRIVTRDEAIDCQRGIQGRCIALVGAKDRESAESMLADLERAKIEVATPKGQVVYSGSLLDFDSEVIRPYLNFVDAGRVLQLALGQSSEVKLASGKLRARLVAANNPVKKKRPTFAAARQAIFAELGSQGWTLKPNLKTPQAQKDIDGHLVILHFKPEAVWMELKNETTSRSTHSDIRDYEPQAWVATIPRWMAIDLKLQRDLDRGYDENPPPPRPGKPGEKAWGVYHPLTGKETFYAGYNEARARKVAIGLANTWPGIPVEYRGYTADSDGRWLWGELQSAANPRGEFIVQQYFGESSKPSWEGPLEDWIDAHPSLKPDTLAVLREMRPGSSFTLSDGTLTQTIRRVDEGRRRIAAGGRMRRNADCGCDHGRAKRMMNPRNY